MPNRTVWTGANISTEIAGLGVKLTGAISKVMQYQAVKGQNALRTNAPWTDQTANARQGLFARSYTETDKFVIVLYHTMPYGIYLETRWSGKYKVIEPTMQQTGKDAMGMVDKIMRKLG